MTVAHGDIRERGGTGGPSSWRCYWMDNNNCLQTGVFTAEEVIVIKQ
jgi:hypothetical protein